VAAVTSSPMTVCFAVGNRGLWTSAVGRLPAHAKDRWPALRFFGSARLHRWGLTGRFRCIA